MFDVCVIGHITKDKVSIEDEAKEMPGGSAYYFPMALRKLGARVCVVTKVGHEDEHLLYELIRNDIRLFYQFSPETTYFENIYRQDRDIRIQKVRSVAQPFSIEDIPGIPSRLYHLGPLTKKDVPLDILRHLSRRGRISMDIQGFMRKIEGDGVRSVDWEDKEEGLTYVNILKADETEAKILTGVDDIDEAAVRLSAYGIDEVVITSGSKGSLIYSKEGSCSIKPFPAQHVDPTGCGDTYMAGYLYGRLRSFKVCESGRFAAATASLKLERRGPFQGSVRDVQRLLDSG
jgi:sugar/nucleoside kinase (ribokinase family)